MFYVINKEKISAYVISIAAVLVLFAMAGTINQDENAIETGANIQDEIIENNTSKENNE